MWEQNKARAKQCINFLTRAIDKNGLEKDIDNQKNDAIGLNEVLMQMTMFLQEFNFYPSEINGKCCEVAFFTSLLGGRWALIPKEKISFEQMFKNLINHCQGKCANKTQYAVIIADNWDDDIANFWQPNIERLKAIGVVIEVYIMIGKNNTAYEL